MDKLFVVSDPHGEYTKLVQLLKNWNSDNQKLIILGDLIDRGENPYNVIKLAMDLKEKYGAKILIGNHEELFLDWLKDPDYSSDLYYPQGGKETINSFFNRNVTSHYIPAYAASLINRQFHEEINFLSNLPFYYERGKFLFVHAGVDLAENDWRESKESSFTWIRDEFHYGLNNTGKIIVFGHTPTKNLNSNGSCDIWVSHCKTKIGIDGGSVFGGLLHGLLIDSENIKSYAIAGDLSLSSQNLQLD